MESILSRLVYDMSLRVRLMNSDLTFDKRIVDLTERESLLIELVGAKENMRISDISKLFPRVSASTISTTITRLWKERGLLHKTILPENQRVTIVNLTEKGRCILQDIRAAHISMYSTVEDSLGMSSRELNWLSGKIKNSIEFFDQQFNSH